MRTAWSRLGILRSAGDTAFAVLALILAMPGLALAAGLTDADYRYLKIEFGLGKDSFALTNMSMHDATQLHEAISSSGTKKYPKARMDRVADLLFDVEMRTCQPWQLAHAATSCPEVTDERLKPGWKIAERNCIACHLTGTSNAPSFFKLVQSGPITEKRLTAALRSGHQMSPITLESREVQELAQYINSLR
jgi:hypothetical protein